MHVVVIPFRGPAGAKSRLAGALEDAQREALAKAMFEQVLGVSAHVAGLEQTLVVTSSSDAAALARGAGARVLMEQEGGLNVALDYARQHLRAASAERVTILAADLPLLDTVDLTDVMRAGAGEVAIAPDRHGSGTNALGIPLGVEFGFAFGSDSLAAHLREAARLGLRCVLVNRPGLAADLDSPADIALLPDGHRLRGLVVPRRAA